MVHELLGKKGNFVLTDGCMYSGKSQVLINFLLQIDILNKLGNKYSYELFKPKIDSRDGDSISSRPYGTIKYECNMIESPYEILETIVQKKDKNINVIMIDEMQFFDNTILSVVKYLREKDFYIAASGLDLDFTGKEFGMMNELRGVATAYNHKKAICAVKGCGGEGTLTQRLNEDGTPAHVNADIVSIEGKSIYEPRCYKHHEVHGKENHKIKEKYRILD